MILNGMVDGDACYEFEIVFVFMFYTLNAGIKAENGTDSVAKVMSLYSK
jgi:hypothetical protein